MDADAIRIARNESRRRVVNEAIEAGRVHRSGAIGFVCECGQLGCTAVVELPLDDYEAVRADARRFLVLDGHEQLEVEEVVERRDGYLVVRKLGAAGESAQGADPRT